MQKKVIFDSRRIISASILTLMCALFAGCGGGGGGGTGTGDSGGDQTANTGNGSSGGDGIDFDNGDDTDNTDDNVDCAARVTGASRQDDYLCAHNAVRVAASPAPVPALEGLVWDDDLADIARSHAEECQFQHNLDAGSGYPRSVGENLYISGSPSANPSDVVGLWSAESADYDFATGSCAPGKTCGHYTQLVWRETTRVGCGEAFCTDIAVGGDVWSDGLLVVCNYSPAGNVLGRRPY